MLIIALFLAAYAVLLGVRGRLRSNQDWVWY